MSEKKYCKHCGKVLPECRRTKSLCETRGAKIKLVRQLVKTGEPLRELSLQCKLRTEGKANEQ